MNADKVIGITVMLVLLGGLVFTVVWAGRPSVTGAAVQKPAAGGMSTDGFSSYDEMMRAHHPGQAGAASADPMAGHHGGAAASGNDGPACGGVSGSNATGEKTEYGVTVDDAGYQQLLQAAQAVPLTPAMEKLVVGLNVELPCCGFKQLQAKDNCQCGHHIAMFGLAKLMASKGYGRDQIQSELDRWKKLFYPNGAEGATGEC